MFLYFCILYIFLKVKDYILNMYIKMHLTDEFIRWIVDKHG